MEKTEIGNAALYQGDCLQVLKGLPSASVQCVVTSPPYWGLRDYGVEGQLGMEETPEEYIDKLVAIFSGVHRVLRDDGTLWLNLGDSYTGYNSRTSGGRAGMGVDRETVVKRTPYGLKPKNLVGIPWRVALALQADGWYLRSDIIWSKPNAMPSSVTDRPTTAHEYIFLLTKSAKYHYDAEAIRENRTTLEDRPDGIVRDRVYDYDSKQKKIRGHSRPHQGFNDKWDAMTKEEQSANGRNKRSVWEVATHPFPDAHFATFPEKLIEPCILAGCVVGGTVLDPFNGSGTTGIVSVKNQRKYIGIDLNSDYIEMSAKRLEDAQRQLLLFEAKS